MARNEARSGRIGLARLEVRSDLEQLFGSAWSRKEAGPVLLLPCWKRPGMEPGVLPSGSTREGGDAGTTGGVRGDG